MIVSACVFCVCALYFMARVSTVFYLQRQLTGQCLLTVVVPRKEVQNWCLPAKVSPETTAVKYHNYDRPWLAVR